MKARRNKDSRSRRKRGEKVEIKDRSKSKREVGSGVS